MRKVKPPAAAPSVKTVDLAPRVQTERYITLTLPNAAYNLGGQRYDVTVSLSVAQAELLGQHLRQAAENTRKALAV